MKTIATAIAAVALFTGVSTKAGAREYCGERYSSSIYISGRASCGTPIYTERYFIRIDRHGHAVWGYRALPVSYHGRHYASRDRGYDRDCDRRYDRDDRCDDRDRGYRDSQRYGDERHREFTRGIYR